MTILAPTRPLVRPRFIAPKYATWQEVIKDAVRDLDELCRLAELPDDVATAARAACESFPLFVPRGYLAKIEPGNVNDPLLRQVLPLDEELRAVAGFSADPVDDGAATMRPGLLQKYRGRVLLVTTGACAVHCRYCFRRHYPYAEVPRSVDSWLPAIEQIAADPSIKEVILSGGDPWTIVDETLAQLVEQLAAIDHLKRLRIHTRLPIVVPQRVTDALVAMLANSRLTSMVVVHSNHARELGDDVAAALGRLSSAGVLLLNQAVLLRGVNDSLDVQQELSERLIELRVMPYYLHQLDQVIGAAHFEVPINVGRRIIAGLRERLPGYAVPHYVQEVPGEPNKVVLE